MKPIVIGDDTEMTSSPEVVDFTVSDKAMHAPHRHSKHAPPPHHLQAAATVAATEKGRKRTRPRGGRRSDLQEEIRFQLEEDMEYMMDIDDDDRIPVSLSPAVAYAARILAQENAHARELDRQDMCAWSAKQVQPPASLCRSESPRVPLQKMEGKKRTCCLASAMSISPSPSPLTERLWGEVA